jgi:hypothetical protein
VVKSGDVDYSDYFTLSTEGLTHYRANNMGISITYTAANGTTDFIPLKEWVEEKAVYDSLSEVRFFKNFQIRKSFRLWRSFVNAKLSRNKHYVSINIANCLTILAQGYSVDSKPGAIISSPKDSFYHC